MGRQAGKFRRTQANRIPCVLLGRSELPGVCGPICLEHTTYRVGRSVRLAGNAERAADVASGVSWALRPGFQHINADAMRISDHGAIGDPAWAIAGTYGRSRR